MRGKSLNVIIVMKKSAEKMKQFKTISTANTTRNKTRDDDDDDTVESRLIIYLPMCVQRTSSTPDAKEIP